MTVRFLRQKSADQKAYVWALALLLAVAPVFILGRSARAVDLLQRSVRVTSSSPGAVSRHVYDFELATAGTLGSIAFEYCANSPLFSDPCVAPAGLSLSGASLASQTGETGFIKHTASTADKIILSRLPVGATPQPVKYEFADAINPSTASQSVYIRISTYASDDATGPSTDRGAVVYSTSSGIGVGGFVPPHLTFCVGLTVANDCSSATGNSINLGLLSKNSTSFASSQFAGATNDFTGYNVIITGTTMTSGNNIIPALPVPTASNTGASQFGVNMRANTAPTIGQDFGGVGTAAVSPDYNIPNRFIFNSGDTVANSPITTDFNTATVSYVINVSGAQPPGVYAATFTYIATASF
ncbi:MAG TPA: hypothetical protein VK963_04050 [Candidatus Saccharimonadales bacterium]|nr:hypothetical protein [Candidatus Saccharimonadales bacterium]